VETSTDISAEAILSQLEKILASPGFIHSDRMVRLLRFTVEQAITGHGSALKETVLGMEVFDRSSSFDPRTDTIVRVEARRLRSKLKEYYDTDGQQDPVLIQFPKGSYVPTFLNHNGSLGDGTRHTPLQADLRDEAQSSHQSLSTKPRHLSGLSIAVTFGLVLLVLALGAVFWQLGRSPVGTTDFVLSRITSDSGLTTDPTVSPDGKLLAYASDRSGEGNLDIWVQQLAGGDPVRLTRDPTDDHQPSFSADGSRIAFRSERDGGGVYVIGSLGGEERLIAKGGRNPRFSPVDNRIIFWIGELQLGHPSNLFLVDLAGSVPAPLFLSDYRPRNPIWSPDGKHVLFIGAYGASTIWLKTPYWIRTHDWWVTSLDGKLPVKTGASSMLQRAGISGAGIPNLWSGDHIFFSARSGDSTNLWRIPISTKTAQAVHRPERLTTGTGVEMQPTVGPEGELIFSSLTSNVDVWSLPVDTNKGSVNGDMVRLTQNASRDYRCSVSANRERMSFLSERSGHPELYMKDLQTGVERALAPNTAGIYYPVIDRAGSRVAYAISRDRRMRLYVAPIDRGLPEPVCEDCGVPDDWSPDGQMILTNRIQDKARMIPIGVLDLRSRQEKEILRHLERHLFSPRVSPDARWIAFHAGAIRTRLIYVAPFRGDQAVDEREWIAITDDLQMDRQPRWSPDGSLLFFESDRDGFNCLWAQALDAASKRPLRNPFPVQHFHQSRLSMKWDNTVVVGFSVIPGQIVLHLEETTGNLWIARKSAP